jgi:hypothetical protein
MVVRVKQMFFVDFMRIDAVIGKGTT